MDISNRYVKLSLLTVLFTAIVFVTLKIVMMIAGITGFPDGLLFILSVLAAGFGTYKLFAPRIF